MGEVANLSRVSLRVINVYNKAKSVIDAINFLSALADIVQGGALSTYIDDGLKQFGSNIDGEKAIESLERNLQPLATRSFAIWSQYLLVRGKSVSGFVVWLPNPGLLPQIRIPAGKIKGYTLTLVAGGKGKNGTVIGAGLGMPGMSLPPISDHLLGKISYGLGWG
jgi:hypothetical protein